jgi:predicted  nucleic acid-binding Zn-ribbon protein
VDLAQILSIAAVLFSALVGIMSVWMKVLLSRTFKDMDTRIKDLDKAQVETTNLVHIIDKEVARLQEFKTATDKECRTIRADLLREAQVMANQLEAIHKKIEHLDEKLDRIRDVRR